MRLWCGMCKVSPTQLTSQVSHGVPALWIKAQSRCSNEPRFASSARARHPHQMPLVSTGLWSSAYIRLSPSNSQLLVTSVLQKTGATQLGAWAMMPHGMPCWPRRFFPATSFGGALTFAGPQSAVLKGREARTARCASRF